MAESNDNAQIKEGKVCLWIITKIWLIFFASSEIKLDCQIQTLYSHLEDELQISTALNDNSKSMFLF